MKVIKYYAEFSIVPSIDNSKHLVNPLIFGNTRAGFLDGAATEDQSGIGILIKVTHT